MIGYNVVEPVTVTPAKLTASNVEEAAPDWDGETSWAAADEVTHNGRLYVSLQGSNVGHEPPASGSDDWWQDLGADNTFAMFDAIIQHQSVQEDTIEAEVTLDAGERADVAIAFNVAAATAALAIVHPTLGEVYNVTKSLRDNSGISNLWRWLFYPIRRKTWVMFDGLPVPSGMAYSFTFDNTDADAKVGALVLGRAQQIGLTQWDGDSGITDYSDKSTDDAGYREVLERGFSDEMTNQVWVKAADYLHVKDLLTQRRAKPTVYIASARVGDLTYGFLSDWRLAQSTPGRKLLSISTESLVS